MIDLTPCGYWIIDNDKENPCTNCAHHCDVKKTGEAS